MARKVPVVPDFSVDIDLDDDNLSSGELISHLKSSFRDSDFSKVESVVVAREAKLKQEIKIMNEENKSMKRKMEDYELGKSKLENELKSLKRRCSQLERAKQKAESETEFWKDKYENLETHISKVEEGFQTLLDLEQKYGVAGENQERLEATNEPQNIGGRDHEENTDLAGAKSPLNSKGSWRPPQGSIIEISDSDDDCAPGDSLLSGQIGIQDETRIIKREDSSSMNVYGNRTSSTSGDGKTGGGDSEKNNLQNLFHKNVISPTTHTSTMPISYSNDAIKKFFSPLNGAPLISRQHEVKLRDLMGQSHMDSSSSSSSSDSEDGMTADKKWGLLSDMILAFDDDNKLYLEAVCALYRQHISLPKSSRSLASSSGRGFDPATELRGTTLAKFLTDGDLQGKLKKSVAELLQYDRNGLEDCKRIVVRHSKQLFDIYRNEEDPLFLSSG